MPKGVYARRWNPISNLGIRPVVPWQERFWQHVDRAGPLISEELGNCWVWIASVDTKGYGRLQIGTFAKQKIALAHRLAWELSEGVRPARHVLHHCDNPRCVRRSHLYEGGHKENAADRVRRGRHLAGSRSPSAKLTDEQIREIRGLDWTRMSQVKVAKLYGVSHVAIWKIVNGKSYQDVS